MIEFPLITNAIPLYRSKRFVHVIIANIEAIDYPNIEIIISDRHQYDDAIDDLERHFAGDTRVTIIKARDKLPYAAHYNLLLSMGRGKYFRWMPHDDSYPVCALRAKVSILEANPQYILANGPWYILDEHDQVVERRDPGKSKLGRWSFETALFIAFGSYEAHAFKGLFRREPVVARQVYLVDTPRIISPERCWEYAMSLLGEFYCYTEFQYQKRYYAGSTHDSWTKAWKPPDMLFALYYQFRYLVRIDGRPLRIITFLACCIPLTLRKLILEKLPSGTLRLAFRAIPGRAIKQMIRLYFSRI